MAEVGLSKLEPRDLGLHLLPGFQGNHGVTVGIGYRQVGAQHGEHNGQYSWVWISGLSTFISQDVGQPA